MHGVAKTSFFREAVAPAVTITARHLYSVCAYSHMNHLILEFPGIVSLLYWVFGPLTPMSSTNVRAQSGDRSSMMWEVEHWNSCIEFVYPMGRVVSCTFPIKVWQAVRGQESGCMTLRWYPQYRSIVPYTAYPVNASANS